MRGERAAALLLLALTACGAPKPAPGPSPSPTQRPSPTPVPVHVTSSGNGRFTVLRQIKDRRTVYIVRARSFEADARANGLGTFEQPHITFFVRGGGATVADAPKAVVTSADKSVVMTGGVRAQAQNGEVLRCDRLRYDAGTETLHGDGHVVLTASGGLTLTGDLIDGDARLAHVRVSQRP